MSRIRHFVVPSAVLMLAACASQQGAQTSPASSTAPAAGTASAGTTPAPTPYGTPRLVKSRDGRFDGEVIGNPAPNSKFAKLQIGMKMNEVTALIGAPDDMVRHETGKRWIPFYFGSDAQRMQVLYKGEGCLTYTAGNVFGGSGNDLIRITATPRADCMQ